MKYYAVLGKDNVCTELKSVTRNMTEPNHIEIQILDEDILHRKYDSTTGSWSADKFLPDRPAIQLQDFDQLKSDKEALEVEVTNLKSSNASNLMTMAKQDDEIKSTKSLAADMLLKMARNSIN